MRKAGEGWEAGVRGAPGGLVLLQVMMGPERAEQEIAQALSQVLHRAELWSGREAVGQPLPHTASLPGPSHLQALCFPSTRPGLCEACEF